MATGVLVLCLGKATRLIPYLEEGGGGEAKEYEATIRFGFETTTDDAEGEPRSAPLSTAGLTAESLALALRALEGEQQQVPPAYSAKKIEGERAYARARRGEEVELKPVAVEIGAARLIELTGATARVRIACSRGTYVRALARDAGRALGVGAHLSALRRTRSGASTLAGAVALDGLTPEALRAALLPMKSILAQWPAVVAGPREAADLKLGRAITLSRSPSLVRTRVRVVDGAGELLALCHLEGSRAQPFCVF